MDKSTLESLAEKTWTKMWTKFMSFGTASAGIIGIFMMFRLFKFMMATMIRGHTLYAFYGFSPIFWELCLIQSPNCCFTLGRRKELDKDFLNEGPVAPEKPATVPDVPTATVYLGEEQKPYRYPILLTNRFWSRNSM